MLGGAFGNLFDRIFVEGGVRDFIYIKCINWPIFNLADAFICIGIFMVLADTLFFEKRRKGLVQSSKPVHD
jgi:signal peptidase II